MKLFNVLAATATGLSLAGVASAAGVSEVCLPSPRSAICFGLAVPETTAEKGTGNVYFRMSAPTSYAWVGFGPGSGMSDANIFVMYADGNGNVTVSPRIGRGPMEPKHTEEASTITLLSGSGVSDDGKTMVAEIRCSDCDSWTAANGKKMTLDMNGTNGFISAFKKGSMASSDLSARITYHDDHVQFRSDLGDAIVASDTSNPFADDKKRSNSSGATNNTGNAIFGDGDERNGGFGGAGMRYEPKLVTHGVVMGLTFAVLYPAGAIVQPLLKMWYLHASWQVATFVFMWVGFGFGYVAAKDYQMLFKGTHTILGTVVCALMALQPILGYLHHRHFATHRRRSVVSHVHINLGRALLFLGIVNGGIGLSLASAPAAAASSYSIIATGMAVTYAGIATLAEIRRRRERREAEDLATRRGRSMFGPGGIGGIGGLCGHGGGGGGGGGGNGDDGFVRNAEERRGTLMLPFSRAKGRRTSTDSGIV